MKVRILLTAFFFIILISTTFASSLTTDEVIDALEASISEIKSYDVTIRAKYSQVAQAVGATSGVQGASKRPIVTWKPLEPGQEPATRLSITRQVSYRGKQRYEMLSDDGTQWIEAKVFTGDTTRQFSKLTAGGVVRALGPDKFPFANKTEYYAALFKDAYLGGGLISLLRERRAVAVASNLEPNGEVKLTVNPDDKANMYPSCAFVLILDAKRGYLPRVIEAYRGSFVTRSVRYEIHEFAEVDNGVWAPIKATCFDGPADLIRNIVNLEVDRERSNWNTSIGDKEFLLPFPAGSQIADETRGASIVTGSNDMGANTDRLVKDAKLVLAAKSGERMRPSRDEYYWLRKLLFVVSTVTFLVLLAIFYVRRKRRIAST